MQTDLHWVSATATGGLPGRCRVLRPPYAIAGLVIDDLGQTVRVRLAPDSIFKPRGHCKAKEIFFSMATCGLTSPGIHAF